MIRALMVAAAWSATLVAFQSAPPPAVPSPATPPYTAAWILPIEETGPVCLAISTRAVFVAHAAGIEAYTRSEGKALWTKSAAGIVQISASTGDGALLAALTGADVIGFDAETGKELWRTPLQQPPAPAYLTTLHDGTVVVAAGRTVHAVRRDGTTAWSAAIPAPATTPLVEAAGAIWLGTEAPSFIRIEVTSGAIAAQTPLPSPPQALNVAGNDIVIVAATPVLARYRIGETKPSWTWKKQRGLAEPVGLPAIAAGLIYVAALDNTLHVFDRDSGSVKWRKPLPSRPAAGPRESDGVLLVPLMNGDVARFSASTRLQSPFAEMKLEPNARLEAHDLGPGGEFFTVVYSSRTNSLTAWRPAAPAK